MFTKIISETKIPPNFLNSILTNNSLYDMFKDGFENNAEYFQNKSKEEYLHAMLGFIEEKLFSKNLFSVIDEDSMEDTFSSNKFTEYVRKFYDDFMLSEFLENPAKLFKTSFFKGFAFALNEDLYASSNPKFIELYNYIFKESINYDEASSNELKPILEKLNVDEKLSVLEFDILCDYVKNNINGFVDMQIVTAMIKKHAYKTNHIFDRDVVEELIKSTCKDYFLDLKIDVKVYFDHLETKDVSSHDLNTNTIYIDHTLVNTFISGNYVELFHALFYEMEIIKDSYLLSKNDINYETYRVIINMINEKVDLDRIYVDDDYHPHAYFADLKSSSFIKTLRFYQMLGVDLFSNYINSHIKEVNEIDNLTLFIPKKEISLDISFQSKFLKLGSEKINKYLEKYPVLEIFYDNDGFKRRTIDIIKRMDNDNYKETIKSYLHSAIIEPDRMIEDISDLESFKSKNDEINEITERLLKYIYVDSFYYSINSYIKQNIGKQSFDIKEYLDDLTIKISCIKDTPLSHRFIDEALFVIEDMKQNA